MSEGWRCRAVEAAAADVDRTRTAKRRADGANRGDTQL